ncbi:MAG: hypothetical protein HQL25_01500 [Candidatus Omnitrophica bacterium]|nr:hypothetical protein [Candidatus Omnitrophota bacterium]
MKKILSLFILLCFVCTSILGSNPIYAQEVSLPAPGQMVSLSPAFNPAVLKGIKLDPQNPFKFNFFVDTGDTVKSLRDHGAEMSQEEFRQEANRLIKYFLASLTIPEKDLWVNLSPYEKDRIVPQAFGKTEMGRDLLAQDYLLKQITASLIYPESQLGKEFWQKVYAQAQAKYGTTDIPVDTFNKVWIVPEKAVVYESGGTAFVLENHLKVMTEIDYAASQKKGERLKVKSEGINQEILKQIIIPALEKEVNEGKNFTQLRQVFYSLILATWYKKKIKDSIFNKVYSNQNKIGNLLSTKNLSGDPEQIYQQYIQAFKKGVYNYIKEEPDPLTNQFLPRKYFSGGVVGNITPVIEFLDLARIAPKDMAALSKPLIEVVGDMDMMRSISNPSADGAMFSDGVIKELWSYLQMGDVEKSLALVEQLKRYTRISPPSEEQVALIKGTAFKGYWPHEVGGLEASVVASRILRPISHLISNNRKDNIKSAIIELILNTYFYADYGVILSRPIFDVGRMGVEIFIMDHGKGIQDIEAAFRGDLSEPHGLSAEPEGATAAGGTGVGLPLARATADQFDIESFPGKGTKIVLKFWSKFDSDNGEDAMAAYRAVKTDNAQLNNPDEYYKHFAEQWTQSTFFGNSGEEQKMFVASRQWFKELDPSKRNELFLILAKRFDFLKKDQDRWFYQSYWFKALAQAAMGWIRDGLVDTEALRQALPLFEPRALDINAYLRMEVVALHLAISFKIWAGMEPQSLEAQQIVVSVQNSLATCYLRDLRGVYDLLAMYFQKDWVPFAKTCVSDDWSVESLDLWEQEMGWQEKISEQVRNPNMPIYFSLPYLRDGRGDTVIAWGLLLKLKERYPSNPIFLITEDKITNRWLPLIEPAINGSLVAQTVQGIRILAYKVKDENFTATIINKPQELVTIEDGMAQRNDYVLIKYLPTLWKPKAAVERTINISDFDNLNFGKTFGDLQQDFFATGFMPGTLGVGVNGNAQVKAIRTLEERRELLDKLGVRREGLEHMKWAVAYLHSLKGLENYVQDLINANVSGPVVLFDLGAGQRGYSNRFPADPYKLPGVLVLGENSWIIEKDQKVIIISFWKNMPQELFQQLLVSSDFAPKIRGAGTMSFLFKQHKPFLIEREISFLDDSFKALEQRTRAMGLDLWEDKLAFEKPVEFNEHNASVLKAMDDAQPWNMASRLEVYTDHLLSGKEMPVMKKKIRHYVLHNLETIVFLEGKNVSSPPEYRQAIWAKVMDVLRTYPQELRILLEELSRNDLFYRNIIKDSQRQKIIEKLSDILQSPEKYLNEEKQSTGGIDLDPAQMSMQVKNGGEDFKFNFNGIEIDAAQVSGVTFTILQIMPVTNFLQIFEQ